MKGICFERTEQVSVHEIDEPVLELDGDAIVRVELAGLCGSDLHPFFGREIGLDVGTVMGHEFVGEVIAVGADVRAIGVGDRVCAPFTTSCGSCFYCQHGLSSRCSEGQLFGWRKQGIGLHGAQANQVRVPLADATLMRIPEAITDDVALLLGDNFSTASFAAEMASIDPNGVQAIVGCGTVGLLSIVAAFRLGATQVIAIDPNPHRLELAASLGAATASDASEAIVAARDRTDGRGADSVMELVGLPEAQKLACDLLRPGGTMSVIGCHCTPTFAFSPVDAYDKNLTYRTGRCPALSYMSRLASEFVREPFDLSWCVTHRYAVDEGVRAYDTFAYGKNRCVKAVIDF